MTGGTFVNLVSNTYGTSKLIQLDINDSATIPFGTWDFQVVAFSGPSALQGAIYCGELNPFVVDSNLTLPQIDLTTSNCSASIFQSLIPAIYGLNQIPFLSKWQTTTTNEVVSLPLVTGDTYHLFVDWGDGTTIQTISSATDPNSNHTYAAAGTYTVTLWGHADAFNFQSYGTPTKIIEVINLGDLGWINLNGAFSNCTNLTTFAGGKTSSVTDMSNMFLNTPALINLDVSSLDTSKVTTMSGMFQSASAVTSLNLSHFNTTNVTNMYAMFSSNTSLTSLDLSSFNTSNVTNMSSMFDATSQLTTLNLANFDTSSVNNMQWMFANMTNLASLNVSSFTTSAVTNMTFMFANSTSLTNLNLISFDTINVTDMSYMFSNTAALTTIVLSSFNTSSVTNMQNMFANLNNITTLDLSNFHTANVTNMDQMFAYMPNLTSLNTTGWNIAGATSSTNVFQGTTGVSVACDQGGSPATGTFFGETCH